MDVHNELGKGFLESVYADALEVEFNTHGVPFKREVKYAVTYKGHELAHAFYADFVVEHKIVLELKAIRKLNRAHRKQTLNYLAISGLKLGLLINFGANSLEHKRVVL